MKSLTSNEVVNFISIVFASEANIRQLPDSPHLIEVYTFLPNGWITLEFQIVFQQETGWTIQDPQIGKHFPVQNIDDLLKPIQGVKLLSQLLSHAQT